MNIESETRKNLDSVYSHVLDPGRPYIWPFRTPHYIRWLLNQSEIRGHSGRVPIDTSIEPAIQSYLEDLLAGTVESARSTRISNSAALLYDQIL